MAKKISELAEATDLMDDNVFAVVQETGTKKTPMQKMADYVKGKVAEWVFSALPTTDKTILGAISELNTNLDCIVPFATTSPIDLLTFCNSVFAKKAYAVPFKVRSTADWAPTGVESWLKGQFFVQNNNYDYREVGCIIAFCGDAPYWGLITASGGKPSITWKAITSTTV